MTTSRSRGLPDEVATYVREQIFSGKVRPGDFLRLEPISDAVGVSSTPVREGLLALSNEGFVELVPRRGFRVASFSPDDIRDLFWAQAKLSGELAARAASKITDEEIAELQQTLTEDQAAFASGDTDKVTASGAQLHRRINRAARAPQLSVILASVVSHLPARFYASLEGHVEATHDDHAAIFDAIAARKPARARKLSEQHTLKATEHLITVLRRRGWWPDEG